MEQYTKFATPTMSGCHMNCRMVHLLWKSCPNCARIGSKSGHSKTRWKCEAPSSVAMCLGLGLVGFYTE